MFYELRLLCPQKEGIFANSWVAAILGVKKLTKHQILNTKIIKMCDEIQGMIISESSHSKKRFSLRLSAILINGTVKIHQQQVIILFEEIVTFMCHINKPLSLHEQHQIKPKREKTKKQVKPKKSTRSLVASEQHEEILHQVGVPERARDITELQYTSEIVDDTLPIRKSFGPGPVEWGDELMREIEKLTELESVQEESTQIIRGIGPSKSKTITKVLEEKEIREDEIIQEGLQVTEEVPQQITDIDITGTPKKKKHHDEELEIVESPRKKKKLQMISKEKNGEKKEVIRNINRKLLKPKKRPNVKHINRCEHYCEELFDKWTFDNIINKASVRQKRINPDKFDAAPFIAEFFKDGIEIITKEKDASGQPSFASKQSLSQRDGTLIATPGLDIHPPYLAPSPRHPTPSQAPGPSIIPEIIITSPPDASLQTEQVDKQTKEAPLDDIPIETLHVPQEERLETQTKLPVVQDQPPIGEAESIQKENEKLSESSKERCKTEELRQKRLAKILYKWNTEKDGEITIDNICPTPITRRTISETFSDLLHLSKMGYVKLYNKPNSLELSKIEKGPKLFK